MNFNKTSEAALETNDIPSQLLEHVKSETLSTDNKLESLEAVESDENIVVKQELLHEEFDIKSEDEDIFDDINYQGNQPCKVKKVFKCNICGYSTSNKSNLKAHVTTHTRDKPFKCNVCGRSFSLNSLLNKHLRIHIGEKPFKCNYENWCL